MNGRLIAARCLSRRPAADHAFRTVVIGAGPGGTGPMIWAAQNGLLEEWLDEGVLLVDADERIDGTIGKYAVNSDSLGRSEYLARIIGRFPRSAY